MIRGHDGLAKTPLDKIPAKLEVYEALVAGAPPLFELKGMLLEEACKSHVANLGMYDMMLQECKTIELYLEGRREQVEAEQHKYYLESSARALGARDLAMYIRSDPQVIEIAQIILDVGHVRRQLEAIVEAFKTMGWSLSNIVKLKVAQLDHTTL